MLRCQAVNCGYSRRTPPILRDVTLDFAPGKLTALIGPNGCGKSTLFKAIMGFLTPSDGDIFLGNDPVQTIGRRALARRVAYLPQESFCPDYLTLGELVELGGYARQSMLGGVSDADHAAFATALGLVGLNDLAHVSVNTLSGGQKQRAWIAMILAQDAQTVLMDEPVNHLDVKYQYAVMQLIRDVLLAQGKTVICVLHDLNLAAMFADEVAIMSEGTVLAHGPVHEVITAPNIKHAFDFDADVVDLGDRIICAPRLHTEIAAQ